MAVRTSVSTSLVFYPKTAIPRRGRNGFIVADRLGDHMNQASGDTASVSLEVNPTITDAWFGQGVAYDGFFNVSQNLDFVRFMPDGRVLFGASPNTTSASNDDLSGWILKAREALLDSKVQMDGIDLINNALLDTTNTDLTWQTLQGTWRTMRPPVAPHRCCIINVGDDETARIRTLGDIPANRWIGFDVHALGLNPAGPSSAVAFFIGNKYKIRLEHDGRPEVFENIDETYQRIRTLPTTQEISLHGGHYVIRFRRLFGRLVIGINNEYFHLLKLSRNSAAPNTTPLPIDDSWPAAPLLVHTFNCRARIGVRVIKNCDAAGTPYSGTFSRHVRRSTPITIPPGEELAGHCATWIREGTAATVTTSLVDGLLDYTVSMVANSDGIDTPCINKVMIRSKALWNTPDIPGLDVASAVLKWDVGSATPPIQPGPEARFELSRVLLQEISASWQTYITGDCPVELSVTEHFDNNTTVTHGLFKGYVTHIEKSTAGMNQNAMTVTCQSEMLRLGEAGGGMVDHRCPPLDIKLFEAVAGLGQNELPVVHGSDAIKEIIELALGPDVAATLNGDGNGQRFFPPDHYPLLSNETGGYYPVMHAVTGERVAPTNNKFFFPPPFGSDFQRWADDIAFHDYAIFCMASLAGYNDGYPIFIYGHRDEILAHISGMTPIVVKDVVSVDADLSGFIMEATNDIRPWMAHNRVLVWANPARGAETAVGPAVRMAEARLPMSDPNAAEYSWEKTLIIRENFGIIRGVAERIANLVIADQEGVTFQWPSLTLDGLASIQWGSLIQPQMAATGENGNFSDVTLGINGTVMRVEKVIHSGGAGLNWTTQVFPRPLSRSERLTLGID